MIGHERKGSGRALVLLHAGEVSRELIDELATRFDVFAFAVDEAVREPAVRDAITQLRIERPLLFGIGPHGIALACAVSTHRIPRGIVLAGGPRPVNAPLLVVGEPELAEAGRLAERVAAFDAPLD
jgi:hypothetical protein